MDITTPHGLALVGMPQSRTALTGLIVVARPDMRGSVFEAEGFAAFARTSSRYGAEAAAQGSHRINVAPTQDHCRKRSPHMR